MELISQCPITGWGIGGFDAHYMKIQAEYFHQHPHSKYAILADNIRHPLNEFLLLTVDFGLIGLCIVLMFTGFTLYHSVRHSSEVTNLGLDILTCALFFSMFSYPFLYPFTWLMTVVGLVCIYRIPLRRPNPWIGILVSPMILGVIICQYHLSMKLSDMERKARNGMAAAMLPSYHSLYSRMKNDYHFLFNYSSSLYEAGQSDKAIKLANECSKFLADYNLCLLKGDIYIYMKQWNSAVHNYTIASEMCPSRFVPLYGLFCVYRRQGEQEKAIKIGVEILNKTEKVKSKRIDEIKQDVRKWLNIIKHK